MINKAQSTYLRGKMLYHTSLQATGYIPSGTTKAKNIYSNGYKAKAPLSKHKHKHKNHSKHHKTEKKSPSVK
jgi:hypothetical protein